VILLWLNGLAVCFNVWTLFIIGPNPPTILSIFLCGIAFSLKFAKLWMEAPR
jgi:hypothetical protein